MVLNNVALLPFVFKTMSLLLFVLSCHHTPLLCSTFVPPCVSSKGALEFVMQHMHCWDIVFFALSPSILLLCGKDLVHIK